MKSRDITINAMFIAITAILALVPNLGIIQIGGISMTIIHIPVIVAGIVFGFRSAVITSLAFGVSSLVVALTRGATPVDMLFINPIVSVFPRLLFGLSVSAVWNMINKFKIQQDVQVGITAFITTLLHAVFVLTILAIFLGLDGSIFDQFNAVIAFVLYVIVQNTIFEAVLAVILSMPLVRVLKKIHR